MTTALVVSRLFPFNDQRVHAVYQRLGMQVEALGRVAEEVKCLFLVPPQRYTAAELSEHQERLRRLWSTPLSLQIAPVVSPTVPASRWRRVGKGIFEFLRAGYRPAPEQSGSRRVPCAWPLRAGPDIVVAHRLSSMSVFMRLAAEVRGRPLFFDLDDIEHVAFARRLLHDPGYPRERLMLLQTPRLWLAELQAMRLATATFVCSEPDRRYLIAISWAPPACRPSPTAPDSPAWMRRTLAAHRIVCRQHGEPAQRASGRSVGRADLA